MTQNTQPEIIEIYRAQQRAMVEADTDALDDLLSDSFTAVHIGGYRQPKAEWLEQISSGRFVYHRVQELDLSADVRDSTAVLSVEALVEVTIAGSRGTWRMRSTIDFDRQPGGWSITGSRSQPA